MPKAMPASTRSNGRSSSAQHHSTFWTLIEFGRPQILSMLHLPRYDLIEAPRLRKAAKLRLGDGASCRTVLGTRSSIRVSRRDFRLDGDRCRTTFTLARCLVPAFGGADLA